MELYAGIDLHSNNSVIVVLDMADRERYRKRLPNDLAQIIAALQSCGEITAVAVESTFNWYWLVDGLQDAGYQVQLVNTRPPILPCATTPRSNAGTRGEPPERCR